MKHRDIYETSEKDKFFKKLILGNPNNTIAFFEKQYFFTGPGHLP